MNCVIPAANLKIMGKALQALSKIGDELYIEANQECLLLRSINVNKTVFSSFEFLNSFFTSYEIVENAAAEKDNTELICKIHMKAILAIFKQLHKDKNIDFCQIELEHLSDAIKFILHYKFDVTVVHTVHLLDMESWKVSYSRDCVLNQICATGQCFSQVLSNFQISDDDLSFEVMHHKIIMRNYDMGEVNALKNIRSQYVLNAIDFNVFKIGQPTNITFSLKPFRSATQFAEYFNMNLTLNFETGGKPAVLVIKSPTFEVNLVMSTIGADEPTQSSVSRSAGSLFQKKICNINLPIQDQRVTENENQDNLEGLGVNGNLKKRKSTLKCHLTKDLNIVSVKETMDLDVRLNDADLNIETGENEEDNFVPSSPESPTRKRIRMIFGRCYEPTFCEGRFNLGRMLVPDSDEEIG